MTVYEFLKTIKLQEDKDREERENQKTTNQSTEQKDLETITVYEFLKSSLRGAEDHEDLKNTDEVGKTVSLKMGTGNVYCRSDYGEDREDHTYDKSYLIGKKKSAKSD